MLVPVLLVTEINHEGWPAMRKSDWNKLVKEAWRRVGLYWLAKMLPKHFIPNAYRMYGYKPRKYKDSGGVNFGYSGPGRRTSFARKRVFGRTLEDLADDNEAPLVFTGTLRRQVLSPARQRVSSTSKGVTIRLRHDQRSRQVHDELTRVNGPEREQLAAVFHRELAALLEQFKGQRKDRVA